MAQVFALLILGAALLSVTSAAHMRMSCDEFSIGSTFPSEKALGTWYLVNLRPSNDPGDAKCVQFSKIGDQERKDLEAKIGQYVPDVKWENLVLKMEIPCLGNSGHNNKTRAYYLEKLGETGSYTTLLIPKPPEPLDKANFNRHQMKLKLIDGLYLALMDCHEHFTFVLDKQPHDKPLQPALQDILKPYLPVEH
ncbi:hypothetical protein NE865_05481 [Phthorimaea operculella]|nr:hypothetical protein NE865_05481 [Phthorimaea operculella]